MIEYDKNEKCFDLFNVLIEPHTRSVGLHLNGYYIGTLSLVNPLNVFSDFDLKVEYNYITDKFHIYGFINNMFVSFYFNDYEVRKEEIKEGAENGE